MPDPLSRSAEKSQLAVQPYVVVLVMADVPPPEPHRSAIQPAAAAAACSRVARNRPLPCPKRELQRAVQP